MDKLVEEWKSLRTPSQKCEGCPYKGKIKKCGGKGNPDARIIFVGEAPGSNENREGMPLVGPSGDVLHTTLKPILEDLGLDAKTDIYYTNAMQCMPRGTSKKAEERKVEALNACRQRLLTDVGRAERDVIVAMGNFAAWALTGNTGIRITQDRGSLIPSSLAKVGIVPILHPSALLRGTGSYRQFRLDLNYAMELVAGDTRINRNVESHHTVIRSERQARQVVKHILRRAAIVASQSKDKDLGHLELAADIETTGFSIRTDYLLSCGFSYDPRHVYIFPEEFLTPEIVGPLFDSTIIACIWHNGKFDVAFLRSQRKLHARVDHDTMLLNYAHDENRGVHDLEQVSRDLLRAPDWKHLIEPYVKGKNGSYANIPKKLLYWYQAQDISNTLQNFQILKPRIYRNAQDRKNYCRNLIPVSEFLERVQRQGITIDTEWMEEQRVRLEKEKADAQERFAEASGFDINLNSPKQVKEVLFNELKIKSKYQDTTKETMKLIQDAHPCIHPLQDFRRISKALGTSIYGLQKLIQADGKLYTTFLIHGTPTGRLASRNPNFQNIPRDPLIRGMFTAAEGRKFVEVDLSQAELRSLACLSGDEFLIDIYNTPGKSLHKEVATKMFGPDYDADQYVRAKAVNFGIVYGRQAPSLAEEFKIPTEEAQRMIDAWFETAPGAKEFIKRCRRAPIRGQTMITAFGRKKRYGVVSREKLQDLQNEAANFPHQSTASDITLHGGMECYLEWYPGRTHPLLWQHDIWVCNLVHDSILLDIPEDMDEKFPARILGDALTEIPRRFGITKVPFIADAAVGTRWGKAHMKEFDYA